MPDRLPNIEGDDGFFRQAEPVLVVNGQEHSTPLSAETYLNAAYFSGTAYFASTGSVAVAAGERLKFELFNPENSGVFIDLVYRRFVNNRQGTDALLERKVARTFTPHVGAARPIIKMNPDVNLPGSSAALATLTTDASATINNSTVGTPMSLNGIPFELHLFSGLPPGQGLIYEIEGANGALTDPAIAEIAYGWVERPWSSEA